MTSFKMCRTIKKQVQDQCRCHMQDWDLTYSIIQFQRSLSPLTPTLSAGHERLIGWGITCRQIQAQITSCVLEFIK